MSGIHYPRREWDKGPPDRGALIRILMDNCLERIPPPNQPMAPVRYYGGKGQLAPWIVQHFPREGVQVYVEPYAGAASVFWHLPKPYPVEVLNDINEHIVNLFRVLQRPDTFGGFMQRIVWTPYSLGELRRALDILDHPETHDEVERAWAFYVALNQAMSGRPARRNGDWGRTFVSARGMAEITARWRERMKLLVWWHDRLTRVQLDCRDALDVIRYWDSPSTLFYVDPPYLEDTRRSDTHYQHETDASHHEALVKTLLGIEGQAVLSCHMHPMYEPLLKAGWERADCRTVSHAAGHVRGSGLRGEGASREGVPRVETLLMRRREKQLMLNLDTES